MQPITYKRLLEVIRKKEKINIVKQTMKEATINEEPAQDRDFGLTALTYTVYENVVIDSNFEYYHTELTGAARVDLQLIYGERDTHDSTHILSRPILENIAKIKRNYDITLTKLNNTYVISNGRHRIIYLKNFYEENEIGCIKKEELTELKELVIIPAKVTKRIEDEEINKIIFQLHKNYPGIFIYKANYLNDLPELIIIYKNELYYVKTKEEISEFDNLLNNNLSIEKYKIITSKSDNYNNVNKIFEILFNRLNTKIYQMDYIDLVNYLKENPIIIEGILIPIEIINLKYLYAKYLEMITTYTLCISRNEELPNDTNFTSAFYSNQRKIGKIIMELISNNPKYKELSWDELYKILHEHPILKKYDSEYLKDIAIENGYQILIDGHFFTKYKKNNI